MDPNSDEVGGLRRGEGEAPARRRGGAGAWRRRTKAEADEAAASAARRLAQAEAEAAERERLAEAVRRQEPLFVTPLNTAPPPPEFEATTGEAGEEHPIMEREGGDVVMPHLFVPPPPPSRQCHRLRT